MFRKIIYIILALLIVSVGVVNIFSLTAESHFSDSSMCQVLHYRGATSGATMAYVHFPKIGDALLTQVHVYEGGVRGNTFLSFGYSSGPFFMSREIKDSSFPSWKENFEAGKNILYKSDDLDVAIIKITPEILKHLQGCPPLNINTQIPTEIKLIGYPVTARRTYPLAGAMLNKLTEPFGVVTQKVSSGRVTLEKDTLYGDADSLPGNSGGPVLNSNNEVIGIIKKLATWYGDGYLYKKPGVSILPISQVIELIH